MYHGLGVFTAFLLSNFPVGLSSSILMCSMSSCPRITYVCTITFQEKRIQVTPVVTSHSLGTVSVTRRRRVTAARESDARLRGRHAITTPHRRGGGAHRGRRPLVRAAPPSPPFPPPPAQTAAVQHRYMCRYHHRHYRRCLPATRRPRSRLPRRPALWATSAGAPAS